jgi:hypothetical protein
MIVLLVKTPTRAKTTEKQPVPLSALHGSLLQSGLLAQIQEQSSAFLGFSKKRKCTNN